MHLFCRLPEGDVALIGQKGPSAVSEGGTQPQLGVEDYLLSVTGIFDMDKIKGTAIFRKATKSKEISW